MKKYLSIIAMTLCALVLTIGTVNAIGGVKLAASDCGCCKDCKDEKCKDLCKQWNAMSPDAKKGDEGKKVKEECAKVCKENKGCSSSGKTCCSQMDGKGCCKK